MARRLFQGAVVQLLLCCCVFAAAPLNLWIDVPFVQQEKNGCGPASVSMVMQYWQKQAGMSVQPAGDMATIVQSLQADGQQAVRASAMVRYFKQNGYRAFAFPGEWTDLEQQIAKGRPVIVALKPDTGSALHYVVVAGVEDGEGVVLVNDPAQRKLLKEDRAAFENEWKATGNWTLLAVPALSVR